MFSHSRFSLIPIFRSKPVTLSRSLYLPLSFHSFLSLSPFIKCPVPSRWHINTRNVARRFGRHGRNFSSGFVCYNISTLQSLSYSNTQVLLNIKHKLGQATVFYKCQWLLLKFQGSSFSPCILLCLLPFSYQKPHSPLPPYICNITPKIYL